MRAFLDATGSLWAGGSLIGKVGSAFTSTGSQHGGQETTLLAMSTFFFHHGMVIVGIPFTEADLTSTTTGGTPYGASHLAGADSKNPLSETESRLCKALGKRLGEIALKLRTE